MFRNYYMWFYISIKDKIKSDEMDDKINESLLETL